MKRKSMFYILAFLLLFSQFVPSIAMATELPETTIEQEQVAEQQKEINTDIEQVEQKEEESKQEITDQKTELTVNETEETKVHSEPVNENPTLTDQGKEEKKVKTASEEKNQPLEAPGPNYLLEDFESGLGSWTVSSARANSVNVSISDEVARFGKHSLKIDYDFTNQPGTSGVYANIGEAIEIPGHPKKISMWVYGDGEKHWLRQILYDANGENFNIDYTPGHPNGVTWEGWKYVEAEIPSNWKPPFKLGNEAIRYMATSEEAKGKATIYIDNIRAIYEDVEEDTTNPTISNLSPSDEQLVYSNQPEIAAHVSDDQSGLDFSKTEMTLDGKPVEPTINEEVGTISYTPVKPLAEGLHKVWVNVADKEGNHSFTTWTFTVETGGPAIDWDVDEDIYAGSQFTANMTVKHVKQFAGMTFNIQYDAKRLTLVDMNPDKEGIQVSIPEKLQSAVSHHKVDPEAGIIEIAFDQMNKIDLKEEETVIGLTYSLGLDASGDFTLNLTDGQYFYADQPAEAVPFFLPAFKGHISQPLKLTLTGLSQATPTTMKVVDKNDQPVSGASISVLGDQKLIKVMKPTSIYKGGSGVAGEPYEPLEVGTLIPVAQTPYDGFDFYRIFMPNGEQRYYHVPMEDVEEVDWGSIFEKTNDQGIIETDQLTLSRIPLKLQAVKGNLVSQVESFTISPQLGKNAPEHITLTWTNDSKTTQHFTWRTDTFTEGSVVEVNPVNVKSEKLIFKGTTTLFGDQTGEMNLHKVEATGLQPGTTYEYRVGDGSDTGWSEYSTFTTEAANNDPFRFMFVADSQAYDKEGFKLTSDLLDLGLNKFPDMKFVVHAGDIVEEGDKLPQWEDFKEATKGVSSKLPLMMVLGNHDVYGDGANIFNNLYSYPQNGPAGKEGFVYSFDYGKARFLMLNSEFGIQDMKEQEEWIREEVRSAGDKWIIAMFHRSPYKSNPKRGEDATQTIFAPLLEELQVDLVLTGHDHAYMRSHPIENGVVQPEGEGTVYLIGGSAGPKFYPGSEEDYINVIYAEEKQVFTSFLVEDEEIKIEAYTSDDELVDNYVLKKGDKTPPVDKTALQSLVDEINDAQLNAEEFTETSWKPFVEALEAAKVALDNEVYSQEEIDELVNQLQVLYKGLEVKEDPGKPGEKPEEPGKPGEKPEEPGKPDEKPEDPGKLGEDPTKKPDLDNTNKGTDAKKATESDSTGKKLPNTATSIFNLIIIGAVFLFVGAGIYLVFRRRVY